MRLFGYFAAHLHLFVIYAYFVTSIIQSDNNFFVNMTSLSKKARIFIFLPIAIVTLATITILYSFNKRFDKNGTIMQWVLQLAEMQHFSPVKLDDAFSEKAFDAYLKKIDPFKQFLTKEDIKKMSVYRKQIDDQIKSNSFQLYDLAVRLVEQRQVEVKAYYTDILSRPFDFEVSETYELDPDKMDWTANSAELKDQIGRASCRERV